VLKIFHAAAHDALKLLQATHRSPTLRTMSETLHGLVTVQTYRVVSLFARKHATNLDTYARTSYNAKVLRSWLNFHTGIISTLVCLGTMLIGCGLLVSYSLSERPDKLGLIAFGSGTIGRVPLVIDALTIWILLVTASRSNVARVREYCEELPQEAVVTYSNEPDAANLPPPPSWPRSGTLVFQSAVMRYRADLEPALKSVSFTIKGGEKIGVVGRTGSGKSTLMLALFRLVELDAGSILFDGLDTRQLALGDLRRQITMVPQDPTLFEGTVRGNLDPRDEVSDEAVLAALEEVKLTQQLASLSPTGEPLQCPVAQRGANLSVGERQLMCLARALLRKSPLLLVDEASANVDSDVDANIQSTLRNGFPTSTVICIAHRLGSILDSDRVLVMDQGVVREFDSPENLLADPDSTFAAMVAASEEGADQDLNASQTWE
jgi:ATP-binding cassette subfamily C (CFTR/MRP) protein 1